MVCPACQSTYIVKNGSIHNGKPKFLCRDCGRQFVENPCSNKIPQTTKDMIDKLLLEKISRAGIVRATGVSARWLQNYVNEKYRSISKTLHVVKKKLPERLTVECDELWGFVAKKANQQWLWLAKDRSSEPIVGCHVGKRDKEGALGLWNSLPEIYRNNAVFYTDFWSSSQEVLPNKRHFAVGKETGQTNHIERFNNTLRQRVSCLVRKTLSFAKKLDNFEGAIWDFIHHYNSTLVV